MAQGFNLGRRGIDPRDHYEDKQQALLINYYISGIVLSRMLLVTTLDVPTLVIALLMRKAKIQ